MNEQEFFDKIRQLVNETNPEAVDILIEELDKAKWTHPSWDTAELDFLCQAKVFAMQSNSILGLVWCAWCKKYLRIEITSEDHDKLALVNVGDGICAVCKSREIAEASSHSKEQGQVSGEGGDLMSPPSNLEGEL